MITEDYVSFETAKLLKEKGFDGDCYAYWDLTTETKTPKIGLSVSSKNWNYKWNPIPFPISAPTLQMAMKWLREIHHLIVLIRTGRKSEESSGHRFWFSIENEDMKELTDRKHQYDYCADAYEQACEDAIKYCLEHLI